MNKLYIDPGLYRQSDIDSGALNMLGAVVHQFEKPGDYRGTVRHGDAIERVFYLSVDKESPVAAADIDLAQLAGNTGGADDDKCCDEEREPRFSVNPRGYALFRVSGGLGGYAVNLRRTDPKDDTPVFNSTILDDGAKFAARVLRPGTYKVSNGAGRGEAKLRVAYPPKAFSGYRPPDAFQVTVTKDGFDPGGIELQAAQGLIFECRAPARILIELVEPDNGPQKR
ncbi:hypothetical protein [Antarctobacter jejuensis]|uniref:hypothetical protein n=1 Tax=Antarctobacter jejuensis TaxID=1439938 RepID=UPI003FCFA0AB